MMFMSAQGYGIENNVLNQDNQSEICMEKNGNISFTGKSRHINIRYFFVKDRIEKGEMAVEHCPTHLMLADLCTKTFIGDMFGKLRSVIMRNKFISDLDPAILKSIKKCVGI